MDNVMPEVKFKKAEKVLLASNSPAREHIINVLDNSGFQWLSVETGPAVVDTLSNQTFDILVTDYLLDNMDIWRLSAIVHSGRFGPSIPIVLLHDSDEIPIPSILTRDYQFASFLLHDIDRLPEFIHCQLNTVLKPSLLIVEDDDEAIEIAEYALKKEYALTVTTNGEEGIESWRKHRHDLVLLDLMLPGISGEAVLKQILATDPRQPVIVVTADGKIESYKNLLLNGAIEFISKPYALTELRRICIAAVNKARLMDEAELQQDLIGMLTRHVWAASYWLKSGNVENASRHLNEIMQTVPDAMPSDDVRASLV